MASSLITASSSGIPLIDVAMTRLLEETWTDFRTWENEPKKFLRESMTMAQEEDVLMNYPKPGDRESSGESEATMKLTEYGIRTAGRPIRARRYF